ncbi:MAG: DsbC family protein [Pseudomonadota bacterium]
MTKLTRAWALALAFMTFAMPAFADDDDESLEAVRATIAEKFPRIRPESIGPGPIDGILEIQQGALVAYLTDDGRYLLQGELIDLEQNRNLTQESMSKGRLELLEGADSAGAIVFGPEDAVHTVTVFTDIDCTFCRKLHREMTAYNEAGIAVRYLFYPRSGPNTRSWEKAEEVWCADNRRKAMTDAKNDKSLPAANCDASAIAKQFEIGLSVGLGGTPAIVMPNGDLISGYVPAPDLASRLAAAAVTQP